MSQLGVDAAALVGAYLLGSIPFSYLVARRFGVADVRRVGSGNVGATNVMRSAGKTAGILALLLDAMKGALAALLAERLHASSWLPAVAGLLAVVGHMYPVWLGFRGGKGVATGLGAFLPLAPAAAGLGVLAFVLVLVVWRYVSLASMLGALSLASATLVLHAPPITSLCAWVAALMIVARHRANLARLRAGGESRMGQRPAAPAADVEPGSRA
jgi:acyl phosphate:glycerol-3-phosphate acyltransferase